MAKDDNPTNAPVFGAKDDHEVILPLTRHADGRLNVSSNPQEAFMASPPKQRTRLIGYREGKTDYGIHAIMAHMESELLNLPDYATARFKALLAELKAKL